MRGTLSIGRAAAVALLGAALLAGCTSNPVGARVTPVATAPAATATTPVPDPTPTTPPPTQRAADATPVTKRCSRLVPTSVARELSAELARQKDWTPDAGTPAAQLADLHGTACGWTDPAGDVLQVAVAKPSAEDATRLKNDLVRRSNSVPTYGGEAYFEVVDHVGRVDAFRGRVWISARSNRFFEPGDAVDVVAAVDRAMHLTRTATPAPTESPSVAPTPAPSDSPTPAGG